MQHLQALLRANVQITLDIEANVPEGIPDQAVRIVPENAKTLKFESFGFEECYSSTNWSASYGARETI